MSVLDAMTHRRKHNKERLKLLLLRFSCFMSKELDLSADPVVMARAHDLLRHIRLHQPSPEFSKKYMDSMSCLVFGDRFALYIDHNMRGVTIVRTETFTNVLQFCRSAA